MRRRNKRVFVLIAILFLIAAVLVGLYFIYTNNKQGWNEATKKPIAYMEYMGSYMTFDENGYVIKSSTTPPEAIPLVMGLEFDYVVVNENLPIEDNELFGLCLEISKALSDADMDINKIELNNDDEIYLYIGGVTVELGTKKNLDKKLVHLKRVADSLKKYTIGDLNMKEYNEKGEYTFTTKN